MPSIFYGTVFLLMTPNANIWEGLYLKTHSDHSKLQNLGIYCMRIRFEWRSYSASFHPSPVNGVEQGVDLHFSELLSPLHLLLKKKEDNPSLVLAPGEDLVLGLDLGYCLVQIH